MGDEIVEMPVVYGAAPTVAAQQCGQSGAIDAFRNALELPRWYSDDELLSAIRAYLEAATPPDVAGLIERLEEGTNGTDITKTDPYLNALMRQAATALRLSAGGGEKGQWKEIETNFRLKGWRTSPAYFPATGEVCEVSGPNCDDTNGYTWMNMTVLWQNEKFVLYGLDGCWPNLHKREHVLFRPLPASPTVEAGHVE